MNRKSALVGLQIFQRQTGIVAPVFVDERQHAAFVIAGDHDRDGIDRHLKLALRPQSFVVLRFKFAVELVEIGNPQPQGRCAPVAEMTRFLDAPRRGKPRTTPR